MIKDYFNNYDYQDYDDNYYYDEELEEKRNCNGHIFFNWRIFDVGYYNGKWWHTP